MLEILGKRGACEGEGGGGIFFRSLGLFLLLGFLQNPGDGNEAFFRW